MTPILSLRFSCRSTAILAGLLLLAFSGISLAAEVRFQADSFLRGFERDTSKGANQSVLPGYLYIQGEAGNLEEPGLSLHFHGWGRTDFAGNDFYSDTSTAEVLYGYLQYRAEGGGDVKLGRFQTFTGAANDVIDGLQLKAPLGRLFAVDLYGGQPVGLADTDGRSGDLIYGGRITNHIGGIYDLGLSYQLEQSKDVTAEEWAAIDLALFPVDWFSLYGISRYSLEVEEWAEHSYQADFILGGWHLMPRFEAYRYDAALGIGANASNPFHTLALSGEELTSYGLGLQRAAESFDLGLDYRHYDYKMADAGDFVDMSAAWRGEGRTRVGGEVGLMQSKTADNDYQLYRVFAYIANQPIGGMVDFLSGELQLVNYNQPIRNVTNAWFASLGCGWDLMDDRLGIKVSGDYASDPYYEEDFRGLLTLSWRYPGVL